MFYFLFAFTSADILFHKFLELHSVLSEIEKKIFVTNFPFQWIYSTLLPHPLNGQKLISFVAENLENIRKAKGFLFFSGV